MILNRHGHLIFITFLHVGFFYGCRNFDCLHTGENFAKKDGDMFVHSYAVSVALELSLTLEFLYKIKSEDGNGMQFIYLL